MRLPNAFSRFFMIAVASIAVATTGYAFSRGDVSSNAPGLVIPTGATEDATNADADGDKLFAPVAAVLRHPRCMNCHPRDDRPRQGEDRHLHLQNVVRGPDGLGFTNLRCTACHRDENNDFSGVPGAPSWHLAPASMGWQGLGDKELCETLKDESKNGGKDVAALVTHMTDDKLVLWGWNPGGDRKPVPVPHAEFVTQLKAWAGAGAPCPQ